MVLIGKTKVNGSHKEKGDNLSKKTKTLYAVFMQRLSLVLALTLLPITLVAVISLGKENIDESKALLATMSDMKLDSIDKFLQIEELKLGTVGSKIEDIPVEQIEGLIQKASEAVGNGIKYNFIDENEEQANEEDAVSSASVKADAYKKAITANDGEFIYTEQVDAVSGASVVSITTPITSKENSRATVSVDIPTSIIIDYINQQTPMNNADNMRTIIRTESKLIYNRNEGEIDLNTANIVELPDDIYGNKNLEIGDSRYLMSTRVLRNGWEYILLVNYNEMLLDSLKIVGRSIIPLVVFMVFLMLVVIKQFIPVSRDIRKIKMMAQEMASFKLDGMLEIKRKDELGDLAVATTSLQDSYRNVIKSNVEMSSEILGIASKMGDRSADNVRAFESINNSASEISQGVIEQANHINEMNIVAERSVKLLDEIVERLNKVNETSTEAKVLAESGAEQSKFLIDSTHEMDDSLKEVKEITDVIRDGTGEILTFLSEIESLSKQSDLLSVNARIQAAQAGEKGQAFAVVADQMNSLAKQTKDMSDRINANLEVFLKSIEAMERKVDFCLNKFNDTNLFVNKTHQALDAIQDGSINAQREIEDSLGSVEHFKVGLRSLANDIELTAEITQENTARLQEIASNTAVQLEQTVELNAEVESLKEMVIDTNENYRKYTI